MEVMQKPCTLGIPAYGAHPSVMAAGCWVAQASTKKTSTEACYRSGMVTT